MFDEQLDKLISQNIVLNSNKKFLMELIKYISEPINSDSVPVLRKEIAKAYEFMAPLIRIKARSEAIYRLAQKEAAVRTNHKGTGRDADINGETANYRYARDVLEGYLDTLTSRLSAAKSILSSLDNELKNVGS